VSASASPSGTPTPVVTSYGTIAEQKKALPRSRDGMQTGAVMGRLVAATPEQARVADAWLRYWQVRAKAFMTAKVDPTSRDGVATGKAAQILTKLANSRRKNGSYTAGALIVNPTRITVNGDVAVVLDCMVDESRDVYADGTMEPGFPEKFGTRGTLKKTQGGWLTDSYSDDQKLCTNEGMEQG